MKKTEESQRKAEEEYKALENKMKNAEAERGKEIKNAQQKLNSAKKKADDSSRKMKEKQQVNLTFIAIFSMLQVFLEVSFILLKFQSCQLQNLDILLCSY